MGRLWQWADPLDAEAPECLAFLKAQHCIHDGHERFVASLDLSLASQKDGCVPTSLQPMMVLVPSS